MTYNLLICGVGGQGILTLSEILGQAAAAAGSKAIVTMDRGLSQRGGSVHAHVRLGEGLDGPPYAPMIPKYLAHGLLSLEIEETSGYADYVSGDTTVVVSTARLGPGPDSIPHDGEAEECALELRQRPGRLLVVRLDEGAGGKGGQNIYLLGVLCGADRRLEALVPADTIRGTIESAAKGSRRENLSLFRRGLARGARMP